MKTGEGGDRLAVSKTCLVIGAGIIGASLARGLARSGAEVTVLDAGEPGGIATRASWAWINASWGNPEPYVRLRQACMAAWRDVAEDLPAVGVDWSGGLIWDLPPAELDAFAAQHCAWGYDIRPVTRAEILALEPTLKAVPDRAYHVPGEGKLEPLEASLALLADARRRGAKIVSPMAVKWLVEKHGRVIGAETDEGVLHADETIVAAGVATPRLLASLGITLKLDDPPGLLAHSKPLPKLLNGLVMTPGLHVRQTNAGRLVAGTDFAGADPKHRARELAHELIGQVRGLVGGAEAAELDFLTVGNRPTPADGFPAIGRPRGRAGLYVCVTHSGITLAAGLARMAAAEILSGERDPLLAPYSPDRPELT